MAHSSSSLSFPADVLYLRGDPFFNFVRQQCGEIVVEVLQMQAINSVHSLLSMDDHFSFFELNSDDLIALRRKVGMTLTDGSFKVKLGVRLQLENLVRSLRELFPTDQHRSSAAGLVISAALLDDYAFLRPLIDFCQNDFQNFDASSDSNMKLLPFFLQTLLTNIAQSDSRNRYSDELKSSALCLYIFAGHNAYEFVRLNIPGALPNSTSIKTYLASSDERLSEGAYRYDAMARHMSLMNSKFAFCAEDCTAVVRKIHYNSHANTFVGFVPDLRNGFPAETCYSTESFDELQSWYAERDMLALLSVNVIQPLLVNSSSSASYILSAYGTNAHYTAFDILRRWIEIVEQSSKRNIRVVEFSSDCDPKFLRAMRLALGFFAHVPNISIERYPNTFAVDVPTEWGWFFSTRTTILRLYARLSSFMHQAKQQVALSEGHSSSRSATGVCPISLRIDRKFIQTQSSSRSVRHISERSSELWLLREDLKWWRPPRAWANPKLGSDSSLSEGKFNIFNRRNNDWGKARTSLNALRE